MNAPVAAASWQPSVSSDRLQTVAVPRHPCEAPSLAPNSAASTSASQSRILFTHATLYQCGNCYHRVSVRPSVTSQSSMKMA